MFRLLVATLALAALSGCLSSEAPSTVSATHAPEPGAKTLRTWDHTIVLNSIGSLQAGGTYIHPGADATPDNCVSIKIGDNLRHLHVQATWNSMVPGNDRLSVFHFLNGQERPGSDSGAVAGTSPLVYDHDFKLGNKFLLVGVEPVGQEPASAGTIPNVTLEITLSFESPMAPALVNTYGCSFDG